MLQIEVNDQFLVLSPNTQIRYEENFPYFEPDSMPVGIVWHFDAPVEGNQEIFQFAQVLQVRHRTRSYRASVRIHGVPIASGVLFLTVAGDVYRISIQLNNFSEQFDGQKANDLDDQFILGGTQEERLAMAKDINAGNTPAPFRFPIIYAPNLYGEKDDNGDPENNPSWQGYVNNYVDSAFVANLNEGRSYNALIPLFFLKDIIALNLNKKSWRMSGGLFADEYFQRVLIHNNHTLDEDIKTHLTQAGFQEGGLDLKTGGMDEVSQLAFNRVMVDDTTTFEDGYYYPPEPGTYRLNGMIDIYSEYFTWTTATNSALELRFSVMRNDAAFYTRIIELNKSTPRYTINLDKLRGVFTRRPLEINISDSSSRIWMKIEFVAFYYVKSNGPWQMSDRWLNDTVMPNAEDTSYISLGKNFDLPNRHSNVKYRNHIPDTDFINVLNETRKTFASVAFFDSEKRELSLEKLANILDNKAALDLSQFVKLEGREIELFDQQPLEISFSAESEKESGFSYTVATGADLPELPSGQLKSDRYALATQENAIYVSRDDEQLGQVVWDFVGTFYNKYNEDAPGEPQDISCGILPAPMASFRNVSPRRLPYFGDQGVSPLNDDGAEPISDLMASAWEGLLKDYPFAASVGCLIMKTFPGMPYPMPFPFDFDLTEKGEGTISGNVTLLRYWKRWDEFQRSRIEARVPLVGIGLVELLNIIKLNRPHSDKRWVNVNGALGLPKQFTAVIDVNGRVKEAEMIIAISNI